MLPWIKLGTSYFSECEHILEDKFTEILIKIKTSICAFAFDCQVLSPWRFCDGHSTCKYRVHVTPMSNKLQDKAWIIYKRRQVSHSWKTRVTADPVKSPASGLHPCPVSYLKWSWSPNAYLWFILLSYTPENHVNYIKSSSWDLSPPPPFLRWGVWLGLV